MSGSLHPNEIHQRQHRREKRNKLRAQLAAAPAIGRAAIEAKLQKTYAVGCGPQQSKSSAHDAAPIPVTRV
jgi:Spy/CpxP family protein refolding chaperone